MGGFLEWSERNSRVVWSATALYMLLIFLISSVSYPPQPLPLKGYAPIIEHMFEFGILGFLLYTSFKINKNTQRNAFILAVSAAILYGISDEIHQAFVPGRVPDLADVLADSIGAIIAITIVNSKMRVRSQ